MVLQSTSYLEKYHRRKRERERERGKREAYESPNFEAGRRQFSFLSSLVFVIFLILRRVIDFFGVLARLAEFLGFSLVFLAIMVFWVFGYGSLVWNPGFEFDEKIIGFIKDHKRVFDLACIDHRGTPENPARTLTLEQKEGEICWGAAFCVRGGPERERLAMEYLERRECEYDQKTPVNFYKEENSSEPALTGVIVFTSTPDRAINKYYLGPAPLEEMASQIATAAGPCGNNRDYLFKLEKAMSDIGHEDEMVMELAIEVRKVLGMMSKESPRKEKKMVAEPHIQIQLKSFMPAFQLHPLPEAIAIAMDS